MFFRVAGGGGEEDDTLWTHTQLKVKLYMSHQRIEKMHTCVCTHLRCTYYTSRSCFANKIIHYVNASILS